MMHGNTKLKNVVVYYISLLTVILLCSWLYVYIDIHTLQLCIIDLTQQRWQTLRIDRHTECWNSPSQERLQWRFLLNELMKTEINRLFRKGRTLWRSCFLNVFLVEYLEQNWGATSWILRYPVQIWDEEIYLWTVVFFTFLSTSVWYWDNDFNCTIIASFQIFVNLPVMIRSASLGVSLIASFKQVRNRYFLSQMSLGRFWCKLEAKINMLFSYYCRFHGRDKCVESCRPKCVLHCFKTLKRHFNIMTLIKMQVM